MKEIKELSNTLRFSMFLVTKPQHCQKFMSSFKKQKSQDYFVETKFNLHNGKRWNIAILFSNSRYIKPLLGCSKIYNKSISNINSFSVQRYQIIKQKNREDNPEIYFLKSIIYWLLV